MMPAIRAENISKCYRIGARGPSYRTLREALMHGLAAPFRLLGRGQAQRAPAIYRWALDGVSFEVLPGEVVGIIGRNGAGKSTLLKVLSRITRPTSGRAELHGRVGSLLEVGTGFHSELTGRENIYLNGAVLGMRRKEIQGKLDRIVDFAGTEEFLDTPVKHYSSGMRVRLAFAVAAHLDTELLLADEVLAVGDVVFQKKCVEEIGSIARHGRTVLFVSHNMGTIAQLCPKTMLLDKGRLCASGKTNDVIDTYLTRFSTQAPQAKVDPPAIDKGMAISLVAVTDRSGAPCGEIDWRFPFTIAVEFRVTKRLQALSVGVTLVNQLGIRLLFSWAVHQDAFSAGTYRAEREFPGEMLSPGRYHVDVGAEHYGVEYFHRAQQAASFQIVNTTGELDVDVGEYGLLYSRVPWSVRQTGPAD